ncbi:MAG: SURF1 family protein [Phaeovulum sp.]|uniref:SURF1 family protein n=1 Tax=Phaeovulum sp. TaxID=2934796 RepID=UPI002733A707|nr:SURF1 family protein [Phaeovulum sp.]MDP3860833.1 SURF1 family protein [Phaeovulum sp.]
MRRIVFPLILGLAGVAMLLALGFWQLDRLAWKQTMLTEISAQIGAPPQALPPPGATEALKYLAVTATGHTTGTELVVLTGMKDVGPGYEVISAFETAEGRRILIDRGFVPEAGRRAPRPAVPLVLTGNLHWPAEADTYTPAPDLAAGVWFARDLPAMAAALGTEPLLLVAARVEGDAQGVIPVPITIAAVRNQHLNYAITWFLLALVWSGMTVFLLWRIRQKQF